MTASNKKYAQKQAYTGQTAQITTGVAMLTENIQPEQIKRRAQAEELKAGCA